MKAKGVTVRDCIPLISVDTCSASTCLSSPKTLTVAVCSRAHVFRGC